MTEYFAFLQCLNICFYLGSYLSNGTVFKDLIFCKTTWAVLQFFNFTATFHDFIMLFEELHCKRLNRALYIVKDSKISKKNYTDQ
jgi:hypothetical protein